MKVITASTAGFCFGVKRAVDLAKQAAADNEHGVLTYGPLIHNASVIADLEKRNIRAVDPEDDAPSDSEENTILIRAHGVGRETERQLKESYGKVVDATCPFVKKIHQIVAEESEKGWTIIIIGSPNHPEVIGISGWTNGDYYVVENVSDAEKLPFFGDQRVCVVAQTTFRFNKFQELVEIIKEKAYNVSAKNTICNATEERQTEAAELALQVDAMLILGDKGSSNSRKLYDICRGLCPCTCFLQTADDLDLEALSTVERVGITAGASTPHTIIEEVQKKCQ